MTSRDRLQTSDYRPQLDALRALAVFAVVIHHSHLLPNAGLAALIGVKFFFVLSGFLITGILLQARSQITLGGVSRPFALRQFYVRRFLRIFPLYYGVIAVGWAIALEPVREMWAWLITYTLNIKMAAQGWFVANFAHFWTLAVEEQFYVVWPWLMLWTPSRWLTPATVVCTAVGPLFRLYKVVAGMGQHDTYILTPACLDSLGMGALLAIASRSDGPARLRALLRNRLTPWMLLASVVGIRMAASQPMGGAIDTVWFDVFLALLCCWVIDAAARGIPRPLGGLLESKPLVYLGKISYGLYVYHPLTPLLAPWAFGLLGLTYVANGPASFLWMSLSSLLLAALSWELFERPINNLKRHVTLTPPRVLIGTSAKPFAASLDTISTAQGTR
jgi:peptidoglycan/LPS O-acetylase OafA/YrhL